LPVEKQEWSVPQVVVDHLSKSFRGPKGEEIRAVKDLTLTLEDKELLALVGPSGCGKTTTLRLIAGLEEPASGTVAVDGRIMNNVPPKDRDLAMVFQNPALYPHLSVVENLAFGLKLRRYSKTEIEQRVSETAKLLELTECLERPPMALSGGQRQRVALGRALVRKPRLFLFDEPFSNLDPAMRAQMRVELSRLRSQLNFTALFVTHDQLEAITLGDRVAVMRQGSLEQVADPLTLYRQPANLFVAGFIGSPPMNFLPGSLYEEASELFFEPVQNGRSAGTKPPRWRVNTQSAALLRGTPGRQVIMGLRPEHITMAPMTARDAEQVTVEVAHCNGVDSVVHVLHETGRLVARLPAFERCVPGDMLYLRIDMERAHFFDPVTGRSLTKTCAS
jgi:multiple sugar transport system ATP-binding protein